MIARAVAVAVAVVLLARGHDAAAPAAPACPPGDRTFEGQLVRVPEGVSGRAPLVIAFHGARGNGPGFAPGTGLDDVGRRAGFLTAYPTAAHSGSWELSRRRGFDDIATTRRLIDALVREGCIDRRRVYATGFSNGASFSARVGCDLAGRVAAIAPVAGSFKAQDACPRRRGPMPTLEQHGRDDYLWTVPRLMRMTAARNGCRRRAVRRPGPLPASVRTVWPRCDLQRIFYPRLGHEWPPGTADRVWRFFRGKRRPA
ncbi:MAG TPA: PHB depolymerase family esterase [Solirubrobacteraceae bacterium]